MQRAAGALLLSVVLAGCGFAAASTKPAGSRAAVSAAPVTTADTGDSPSESASSTATYPDGPSAVSESNPVANDGAPFAWSKGYVVFCEVVDENAVDSFNPDADNNPDEIAITPWVSSDGHSWQPGQPLDVAGLSDLDAIGEMVDGPEGLVAVGQGEFRDFGDSDPTVDVTDAVIGLWTSKDGKAWSRLNLAGTFGVQALGDVAAGPRGYIASNLSDATASIAPAVWLSADGRKWRSVALGKGGLAGAHLGSAYVLPSGYLLAGWKGVPVGQELDTTPAVWFSPDGLAWREANLPNVVAAPMKEAVVQTDAFGRYTVVVGTWSCGCEPPRDNQTWTSTDGSSWQMVTNGP